jgi:hypothetical protein
MFSAAGHAIIEPRRPQHHELTEEELKTCENALSAMEGRRNQGNSQYDGRACFSITEMVTAEDQIRCLYCRIYSNRSRAMIDIGHYKDPATVIGVSVAAVSLAVTAITNFFNYLNNRAKLWIDLRTAFARHDDVHKKLRPGGNWFRSTTEPSTHEDFADAEAYMGLLEYCEIMMANHLVDQGTFERLFSYRLRNILSNRMIFTHKLVTEQASWTDFIALCQRVKIDLSAYAKEHNCPAPGLKPVSSDTSGTAGGTPK